MMKLRLIHIRVNKKLGIYQVFGLVGSKYAGTTYRVAYEIIENKVIPVCYVERMKTFMIS